MEAETLWTLQASLQSKSLVLHRLKQKLSACKNGVFNLKRKQVDFCNAQSHVEVHLGYCGVEAPPLGDPDSSALSSFFSFKHTTAYRALVTQVRHRPVAFAEDLAVYLESTPYAESKDAVALESRHARCIVNDVFFFSHGASLRLEAQFVSFMASLLHSEVVRRDHSLERCKGLPYRLLKTYSREAGARYLVEVLGELMEEMLHVHMDVDFTSDIISHSEAVAAAGENGGILTTRHGEPKVVQHGVDDADADDDAKEREDFSARYKSVTGRASVVVQPSATSPPASQPALLPSGQQHQRRRSGSVSTSFGGSLPSSTDTFQIITTLVGAVLSRMKADVARLPYGVRQLTRTLRATHGWSAAVDFLWLHWVVDAVMFPKKYPGLVSSWDASHPLVQRNFELLGTVFMKVSARLAELLLLNDSSSSISNPPLPPSSSSSPSSSSFPSPHASFLDMSSFVESFAHDLVGFMHSVVDVGPVAPNFKRAEAADVSILFRPNDVVWLHQLVQNAASSSSSSSSCLSELVEGVNVPKYAAQAKDSYLRLDAGTGFNATEDSFTEIQALPSALSPAARCLLYILNLLEIPSVHQQLQWQMVVGGIDDGDARVCAVLQLMGAHCGASVVVEEALASIQEHADSQESKSTQGGLLVVSMGELEALNEKQRGVMRMRDVAGQLDLLELGLSTKQTFYREGMENLLRELRMLQIRHLVAAIQPRVSAFDRFLVKQNPADQKQLVDKHAQASQFDYSAQALAASDAQYQHMSSPNVRRRPPSSPSSSSPLPNSPHATSSVSADRALCIVGECWLPCPEDVKRDKFLCSLCGKLLVRRKAFLKSFLQKYGLNRTMTPTKEWAEHEPVLRLLISHVSPDYFDREAVDEDMDARDFLTLDVRDKLVVEQVTDALVTHVYPQLYVWCPTIEVTWRQKISALRSALASFSAFAAWYVQHTNSKGLAIPRVSGLSLRRLADLVGEMVAQRSFQGKLHSLSRLGRTLTQLVGNTAVTHMHGGGGSKYNVSAEATMCVLSYALVLSAPDGLLCNLQMLTTVLRANNKEIVDLCVCAKFLLQAGSPE